MILTSHDGVLCFIKLGISNHIFTHPPLHHQMMLF
jgi:hypothetical protein